MSRTPNHSDSEIIDAYHRLKQELPDRAVTGSRMRLFFGDGHDETYKKAIKRLQSLGELPPDDAPAGADPLEAHLANQVRQLAKALRSAADDRFEKEKGQWEAEWERRCEELQQALQTALQQQDQLGAEKRQLQEKLEDAAERLEHNQSELKASEAKRETLQNALTNSERKATQWEERFHSLETSNAHLNREIRQMTERNQQVVDQLERELLSRKAEYSEEIKSLNLRLDAKQKEKDLLQQEKSALLQSAAEMKARIKESTQEHEQTRQRLAIISEKEETLQQELQRVNTQYQDQRMHLDRARMENTHFTKTIDTLKTTLSAAVSQPESVRPKVLFQNSKRLVLMIRDHFYQLDKEAPEPWDTANPLAVGERIVFPHAEKTIPVTELTEIEPFGPR